jgi:fructose-1,6-bisphosphatase II
VRAVRDAGARVHPLAGGEIAGALAVARPGSGVEMLLGVVGAREAVIVAAALACAGGSIQARPRSRGAGRDGVAAVLHTPDLVGDGDVLLGLTGVTGGADVPGVAYRGDRATTHSLAMSSGTGTVQVVESAHRLDRPRDLLGV